MNATILHESRGRIRFRLRQKQMTLAQADLLEAWIQGKSWCRQVTVHERTCCVILYYDGTRQAVLNEIRHFSWQEAERTTALPAHSSRALNREFEEKLVAKVVCKAACTLFLPSPLRIARILWHMIPFVRRGLRCLLRRRIKVELLDALSISISACRRDFGTAGMVMFLLEVGELLEEWTRKKSVADLARCMSLNVDRVWLRTAQGEVLVPVSQIQPGDAVVVRAGGIIPVDGLVLEGEVTVNQASLTGESIPVPKRPGGAVYAGTVVEEGECVLEVKQASGQSRYDQIVHMIEQSEQMKSEAESKAANLADKLVPYTFAGSLLSFALTRNVTRALSVLMVDFSCALKLAMPLAVLSAMREAGRAHITVKGGKFLEAVAEADTIVFDKTGWLRWYLSAPRRKPKCCGWPPAWRSTSPIPWPTPWWRRRSAGACVTRSTTPRWNIWWPTASPAPSMGSGSSSAAPTLSLRMRAASFRKANRSALTPCRRSILTCIWP